MIRITINRNGLEAIGHANYAAYGQDIVCAGVSALINSFELSASEDITAISKDGYSRVEIKNPTERTMAKFSLIVTGLEAIAEDYPDYVAIYDQAFMSIKGTIQSSIETITHE